jgi:hypothetical protein
MCSSSAAIHAKAESVHSDGAAEADFGFIDIGAEQSSRAKLSSLTLQESAAGVTFTTSVAVPSVQAAAPPLPPGEASLSIDGDEITAVSGVRAFATRPDANPHAVVDRLTPNRMLGGPMGFFKLVQEARQNGIRVMVQMNATVSASRPHRKYKHLYARTLDTKGQATVHYGTDSLENQWEDQQLLNYRKVRVWFCVCV